MRSFRSPCLFLSGGRLDERRGLINKFFHEIIIQENVSPTPNASSLVEIDYFTAGGRGFSLAFFSLAMLLQAENPASQPSGANLGEFFRMQP